MKGKTAVVTGGAKGIVVPIIRNNRVIGVLDIDSPVLKRFDQADAEGLSDTVALLNRYNRWSD
jgi:L-methionine (R)-S-oxide reductase